MRVSRRSPALALVLGFSALGLAGGVSVPGLPTIPAQAAVPPLGVRHLDTPAGPGGGGSSLALLPDGRVLLSWLEPVGEKRHALRYALRPPGGAWSEPLTIAEGDDWFVNWADFPSVAALPDGVLFAHWLVQKPPTRGAYDVNVSVSRDGGRSWSPPVVPHRDGTATEHGFVSMTPSSPHAMDLVWLDGRQTTPGSHEGSGSMALVHATLGADSRMGAETVLDGRVCDCCQTDAARSDQATLVVYRDRSQKEVRDISIVRQEGGRWSEPRTVAADAWEINGCPVNGPAIAADGRNVTVAWYTMGGGTPRVKAAFSTDSGATFAAPVVVDDGQPLGRVDVVAVEGGEALVAWLERTGGSAALRLRRVAADGTRGEAVTVAESSAARASGFPRLVKAGDEVVFTWRDSAEPPRVRSAVVTAR